ncbi:MAG: PLP-dependent aminotransferase family protein [Candidatus Obscuribacterales bacterium]|nr:PLP-dependent aminotransferase family protein [Candidatus Obscuribacterales bacterium]
MKALHINLKLGPEGKYKSLTSSLRQAIRQGSIKPGERLPSSRDLAKQLQMHRHTVMTALTELESEGWVQAKSKRFYQVTETLPDTFLRIKPGKSNAANFVKPRKISTKQISIRDHVELENYRHSFPSGMPELREFPITEFKSHIYDALKSKGVLSYGPANGAPKLIEEISAYLRRVRGISDKSIVITNGSQEAIFLLSQLLITPGDCIAVESLSYQPSIEAMRFAGAKIVPIAVDQEGLVIERLEASLKKNKIKLLYTTPLHQYPTTVTMSASRRLRLYQLALKHGFIIIEDDYDHEFHFAGQPVAPLASFDPAGIVLYMSSFSKILFPSARIGFLAVPESIGTQLAKLKQLSSRQNENIIQIAIANWMRSGGFESHLRKMRKLYAGRKEGMVCELLELQKKHPQISWRDPDGGMALWLCLGEDSSALAQALDKQSILLSPEKLYRLDGKSGTHVRLGFSGRAVEENSIALREMFKFID